MDNPAYCPALDRICTFVIETLPDSMKQRQRLLNDLLYLLPETHPLHSQVALNVEALNAAAQAQLALSLQFQNLTGKRP